MKMLLNIILYFIPVLAFAQVPEVSWGPAIDREPRELRHIAIVGTVTNGFYAVYEEEGQVTLERYNEQNLRIWATALRPTTPTGQPSEFVQMQLLQGKLYMLSKVLYDGITILFAQEIDANGNYSADIQPIATGNASNSIRIASTPNATLVIFSGEKEQGLTATLLNAKLKQQWSKVLPIQGLVQETAMQEDGTSFILEKTSAPAAEAFQLHRLNSKNGKSEIFNLSNKNPDYRPLNAKLVITPRQSITVAGYMVPASNKVTTHQPEPVGTFFCSFNKGSLKKPSSAFTPFDSSFTSTFKPHKPDSGETQRLRSLTPKQLLALKDGGAILIGEVTSKTVNNTDIIIMRLRNNDSIIYTTNVGKRQTSPNDLSTPGSYFATALSDTLQLVCSDTERTYTGQQDTTVTGNPTDIQKMPFLITVFPDGKQQVSSLPQSQIDKRKEFHLRPGTSYKVSPREFIVFGVGEGYYKYGRLRF
ncbi:hypothetical protein ACFSKU_13705 [Pontibacter silvestris]|uniref:Uncharacterized protein n=1 Tax=Pontibacter silvestris TaxID=2305183 RepID=A0ABW4X194_9BACT|nr:hypothetical protein [Pontibacter silvestris]MCC9135495.1 hypothetical protein [Pontibacter silvestris]